MNKNIDLTKILEGCPEGTKLYSPLYGVVEFSGFYKMNDTHLILIIATDIYDRRAEISFLSDGSLYDDFNGYECLLFPSEKQRDWTKFERFWDKPKIEKFDPKTFQPFDKVLVSDGFGSVWRPDLYSFNDPKYSYDSFPIVTSGGCYRYAIPYNDDTKHLVGTTNDCPEYYKWWEK